MVLILVVFGGLLGALVDLNVSDLGGVAVLGRLVLYVGFGQYAICDAA